MKHSPFLIILLTLLCLCWDTAQAREHEWTNTRGQTIKAEFIFMKGDNVTISMKGKTYGLKLSSLSPESQALARKLSAINSTDKLTPEEVVEVLGMRLGEWASVEKGKTEPFEEFVCRWKIKGESMVATTSNGLNLTMSHDPERGVFVEKMVSPDGNEMIRHGRWDRSTRTLALRVVFPQPPPGVVQILTLKKTDPDTIVGKFVVRKEGEIVFTRNAVTTRKKKDSPPPPNRPAIGFSVLTLSNPYFKEMVAGMQEEAAQQGAELLVEDADLQFKEQKAQIDAFIAQNVKAIALVPTDRIQLGPVIRKANLAGIPVFTIDAECTAEGVQITGHVGTDNYQGGQLAGQAMAQALGPQGGQVLVLGFKVINACVLRVKGFREVIDAHNAKGQGGKIEIVAEADGGASQRKSQQATAASLQDHPDLAGIFAINDPSALGAYQAAKAAGREKQVKVIGFDGTKQGRDAIREGKIYASPIQFPDRMGKRLVENVFAHLTGKEFKQADLVPTEIYRREDALAEEQQASVQAPSPVSEELPDKLLERVWKDKHGRLIWANFVSLVGDNLTISMKDKPVEVKLSSLSPESQSLARALARTRSDRKLSAAEVAELFAKDIGTWKINGYGQPVGGERVEIEDEMEIRWKEKGKSYAATFSPSINGKEVPFTGTKEYDAQSGFFVLRSKGEGFPPNVSYECYDPVAKMYHGKSTYPDGAMRFGFSSAIDEGRSVQKTQIFFEEEIVFNGSMDFLLVPAGQVRKGDKLRLAFVTNQIADFWNIARSGCLDAQRDLGVDVVVKMPPQASVVKQKQIVEDLIAEGIDGIAISPLDADNQTAWLNEIAAQVPLITHDSDAPESKRRVYLGMDNYKAGRMCGELVKKALPNGGGVMLFVGRLGQDNAKQRRQGVIDELFDRPVPESHDKIAHDPVEGVLDGGKYKILGTAVDKFSLARARQMATDAIVAHPDMKAMVGLFEYNLPACYQALKQAGKLGKIKLVGFDENDVTLQGIKKGFVTGTIVQNPYQYGYQSVKVLKDIIEGKDNLDGRDYIDIVARKITKENVDAYWTKLKRLKAGHNSH
ncbi:MAG: substrate-binding domain-containing protein [Opitutae bacterium]|nr:substrate-binding domain-containing protein [Opitutae bacterium]